MKVWNPETNSYRQEPAQAEQDGLQAFVCPHCKGYSYFPEELEPEALLCENQDCPESPQE